MRSARFSFLSSVLPFSYSFRLSGSSSERLKYYSTLDLVEDYSVVEEGVFFYSPPEDRDFFETASLCCNSLSLKCTTTDLFAKREKKNADFSLYNLRGRTEENLEVPCLHHAFSKVHTVGTIVPEFRVSPIFEEFGHLWQWRSLTLLPSNSNSSSSTTFCDDDNPPARKSVFFMVPFLLYPGQMVETKAPILCSEARDEIHQRIKKILGSNDGLSAENALTYDSLKSVVEKSAGGGDALADSLIMPTAIGNLCPAILLAKEEQSSSTLVSNGLSNISAQRNGAMWASTYFNLLDVFIDLKGGRDHKGCNEGGKNEKTFQPLLQQKCGVEKVEFSTDIATSHLPAVARDEALQWLPQQKIGECPKLYAERCWMSFVGEKKPSLSSISSTPSPEEAGKIVAEAHPPARTALDSVSAAHPALSPFFSPPKSQPVKKIPSNFRNVIGGGLAELILSLDRYAALISRGEMSVPAACWALLCDMTNPEAVFQLRSRAVMLEQEVLNAVKAHKQFTLEALKINRSLVGKSCHGGITLLNYPQLL